METNGSPARGHTLPDFEIPWATDLLDRVLQLPRARDVENWAVGLTRQPAVNLLGLIGLTSILFFEAEKHRNPKVKDIWDALVYCSTCVSVGYGDIFAHTPTGKILGSLLMTVGPAMAAKMTDGPSDSADTLQRETLATLQEILAELQARTRN